MAKKEDEHPLRMEEVFGRAGIEARDDLIETTCDVCGQMQTLRQATIEPAEDPNDITAYRCMNGCAVVAITGFPSPVPLQEAGRYQVGDYCVEAHVEGGFDVRPV